MSAKEKFGALILALCMAAGVLWPTIEGIISRASHDGTVTGLTYDEANDECAWISAADNVWCYVLPDGDMWKAVPE